MPRWSCASCALVAVLLAGLPVPVFRGPELVPAAAAVSALSVWMLSAGVWVMRPGPSAPALGPGRGGESAGEYAL